VDIILTAGKDRREFFNMNKKLIFCVAGLALLAGFLGAAPSFNSLPEMNQPANVFIGPWMSNDAHVSESYGSARSVIGRQFYVFYDDGTGEIVDYNGDILTNRRVFQYRFSDTLIGFRFLKGTIFTNGGSFTRPYSLSGDGRQLTFPYQKNGISYFAEFTLAKTTPPPAPPPPPPEPLPEPLAPSAEPINNSGQIYYSYDGTGYVYKADSVFYRCSNGRPLGYVEGDVIYSFAGKALGFVEKSWIYNLKGYPVGAADPKYLGNDAAAKKPVSKAAKQGLPAKQTRTPVNKPKLRDGYFGGVLSDIFS
jgi:hypothetical protein